MRDIIYLLGKKYTRWEAVFLGMFVAAGVWLGATSRSWNDNRGAFHAYFTQATQPFQYARYTVFLAEIASSLNEVLLIKYLLATFPTGPERVVALVHYIDIARFYSAFFRQTLLADFERQIHACAEAGNH